MAGGPGWQGETPVRRHESVNHSADEWVVGDMHTNSVEGVWSLFKRSIMGAFHKVSAKHLDRYLEELEWRFNNRENPHIFRDALRPASCTPTRSPTGGWWTDRPRRQQPERRRGLAGLRRNSSWIRPQGHIRSAPGAITPGRFASRYAGGWPYLAPWRGPTTTSPYKCSSIPGRTPDRVLAHRERRPPAGGTDDRLRGAWMLVHSRQGLRSTRPGSIPGRSIEFPVAG